MIVAGRGRGVACALLAGVLSAACDRGQEGGTEVPGPYAETVASVVPQIEKETGLRFTTPPRLEVRSKAQVREFVEEQFNDERAARELAGAEAVYRRFGLLPDTMDLRAFMLDLLTEQVAGYYDPETKILYVVEGANAEIARITVAHELVHALQDQHLNLDSLQTVEGQNDRTIAAQAVVEGQATFIHIQVLIGGGNLAAKLPGGWDRVREMIREQQTQMPIFSTAPLIIQETLIFPYLSGAEFARRFGEKTPDAQLLRDLPVSTEQILHAEAFFGVRDAPTAVTLPEISGTTTLYENNLGEFETRLLLYQHLRDQPGSIRAARGWDGDRYRLVRTAQGDGLVWATVWDSAVDAGEFREHMDQAIAKRYVIATSATSGDSKTYQGAGRSVTLTVGEVAGRPVVLYTDVPAGASLPLALGRIGLR